MATQQSSESHLDSDTAAVVDGCNQFALDLYSKLASTSDGNLFFSPSSLSLALAMTLGGADGETAREMAETLRLSLPSDRIHEAFRRLQAETQTGGIDFRIANRLWGQQGYRFLDEFLNLTERCYGAKLETVDFQKAPESARQSINTWIAEKTAEKIPELIGSETLDPMTRLVLTNAIYFWGNWEKEFNVKRTAEAPFWTGPNQNVTVPMMEQTSDFPYGEFDELLTLELPYRSRKVERKAVKIEGSEDQEAVEIPGDGSDFAMSIFLPRKADGLARLEGEMSAGNLQKWTTLKTCEVHVGIPKYRIEGFSQLDEPLRGLGMNQAFSVMEADFSKMADDPAGLYIKTVLHKALVDVNEKGTEAAAATAVVMAMRGAAFNPPKEFRADHPFVFLIRDRRTRLIHFLGRIKSPPPSA